MKTGIKIFLLGKNHFQTVLRNKKQPALPGTGAQADSIIGESAFLDCFNGAVASAGTAVDTDVSVDNELAVTLGDSFNGAILSAGAAVDTCIGDFVSHDFPSNKYSVYESNVIRTFILTRIF